MTSSKGTLMCQPPNPTPLAKTLFHRWQQMSTRAVFSGLSPTGCSYLGTSNFERV